MCHLLALLGAHLIFHISRIRVKMVALVVTHAVPLRNLTTGRPEAIFPTVFPVSEHNYSQSSFITGIIALKIAM
jgi:hypothetical protein